MSGLIIENDGSGQINVDGKNGNTPVSMQVYQDIYHQITGKCEEISKIYKNSIQVEFDDIEQLDVKIKQILEQWNVVSANSSFTIYFDKNQKETFSSIERFSSYNKSTNSQSESVVIKYNFAVVPPQAGRVQNYTINVKINSRIVAHKKILEELPFNAPSAFVGMLSAKTAEIKIEFIDYVYARTIIASFDEWLNALHETKANAILSFAKKYSHFIPRIFKFGTLFVALCIIYFKIPAYIQDTIQNAQLVAYFMLFSMAGTFYIYKLTSLIGHMVENAIDSTIEISYLKLTKGDDKNITEALADNKKELIKAAIGAAITFALNFLAKYLAVHI